MSKIDITQLKDAELVKEIAKEREALRVIKSKLSGTSNDVMAKRKHQKHIARMLTEMKSRLTVQKK